MILYYDTQEAKFYTREQMEEDIFPQSDLYGEISFPKWLDIVCSKNGQMEEAVINEWIDIDGNITEKKLLQAIEEAGEYNALQYMEDLFLNGQIKPIRREA